MDQYSETRTVGFFEKVTGSIMGFGVGFICFFAGIYLLFYNEGRIDISRVVAHAVAVAPTESHPELVGKLVSVTGPIEVPASLGDAYIKQGAYVVLRRMAEMYAWHEQQSETRQKKLGGSEEVTTTYNYQTTWVSHPSDSTQFKVSEGHTNPTMRTTGEMMYAPQATMGQYSLHPAAYNIGGLTRVSLSPDMVASSGTTLVDNYLFLPATAPGNYHAPQVGDERISYEALTGGIVVTVFGTVSDHNTIEPYMDAQGTQVAHMRPGTVTEARAALHAEHTFVLWLLRFVGFFLIWIGLMLVLKPFIIWLDIIPLLGDLSGTIVSAVTLILAAIIAALTIVVSKIVHSFIALSLCVVVLCLGVAWLMRKRRHNI